MPEERVTALREAFRCAAEDEDLVAEVLQPPEEFRRLVADNL